MTPDPGGGLEGATCCVTAPHRRWEALDIARLLARSHHPYPAVPGGIGVIRADIALPTRRLVMLCGRYMARWRSCSAIVSTVGWLAATVITRS